MKKINRQKRWIAAAIVILTAIFYSGFFVFTRQFSAGADCSFLVGEAQRSCFAEKCEKYTEDPKSLDEECSKITDKSDQEKCKKLNDNLISSCKMIDLKAKQGNTLQRQLTLIETEKLKTQNKLAAAQQKIAELLPQLEELERKIDEKETTLKTQRVILAGLLQAYYEHHQQDIFKVVLLSGNFANIAGQSDYLDQTSGKMSDALFAIRQAKEDLKQDHYALTNKKNEFDQLKQDLEEDKADLAANETQKQSLLTQTQGAEAKYQQLLARVEQQKAELFDFSTASNLNDVMESVSSYAQPDKKYWDSKNFYLQWDSRWANKKIGGTKYLMKDVGCAVTSVAMAYQFNGKNYTPQAVLSSADFTSQALIFWPAGWQRRTFNSSVVDNELKNGKVVIVHIKKGTTAGHFVVIHHKPADFKNINDYVVHDPYFGANLYLGTSRSLVGKLNTNSSTTIDIMVTY